MFTQEQLDRIIGADLIDSTGDRVGEIGTVFFDDVTGLPSWVTVRTGFFGMNESFVPVKATDFDGDAVRVPFEKPFIKDAPNIDVEDGHLTREEEAELYRYYGLDAAVAGHDAGAEPGTGTEPAIDDLLAERDRRGEHGDEVRLRLRRWNRDPEHRDEGLRG